MLSHMLRLAGVTNFIDVSTVSKVVLIPIAIGTPRSLRSRGFATWLPLRLNWQMPRIFRTKIH